jgi:hypothetical protein
MIGLLVSVLIFALLVSLIAVASSRIAGRALARTAGDRIRSAEHIARTHRAPRDWADARAADGRSDDRLRAALVRRLEQVISTMKTAPVFEDDRARALLLGELDRVLADWLNRPLESIVAGPAAANEPPGR